MLLQPGYESQLYNQQMLLLQSILVQGALRCF